jgi:asparagine synthase (glutamine-hydrolysing)
MSGIAGLLHFDGRSVSERDLDRAANALRQHGPDRSGIAMSGSVGLAHVLMRMTPEDRFDRQPWQSERGSLITADVRLDNRDDVLARVAIAPRDAVTWPDSRVLLAAWEQLGDAVWPMVRGPFAAAIWDPRVRTLTLARDHLGLNVVMWHKSEQFFAFSSMPKGLFAFADIPRELNEEKIADFLVLNHSDHATTIYRNIFRVPPGHLMQIGSDSSIVQQRYWSPHDIAQVRRSGDQDYADGLRECLDQAVRRQMRSAHSVGCLLSGGLDSSSVSVLAARALGENNERLAAFTGVPRRDFNGQVPAGHYADESPYVEAIARAAGNMDVTYVSDDTPSLSDLERFFVTLEGPVRNPTNLGWVLAILRLARTQGLRVLLGGFCGNSTISWNGWSQAVAHLLRGQFLTAYRQGRLYYRLSPYSRLQTLSRLFGEPLMPERLATWVDGLRHPRRAGAWQDHSPIHLEFAAAMAVDARARAAGHDFLYRMRTDERVSGLFQADYAGDWHAAEKAVTGVEVRDPTADIDVVSYCFGVPPEQYLVEGIDRSLIRRAMWGLLPATVLTNRLSGLQGADWYEKLDRERAEIAQQIAELSKSALVSRVIDLLRLKRTVDNWPAESWHKPEVFSEFNLMLMRGIAGGRFLRWFESAN